MYSHEKQSVSPSISTAWFPQNQIAKPPGPFGLTEYVNLENGLMNQSSCQGVMLTVNVWRLKFCTKRDISLSNYKLISCPSHQEAEGTIITAYKAAKRPTAIRVTTVDTFNDT